MELHMPQHKIVSQSEWTARRKALLAKEKEFTRARDRLSAERRALPWVKVETPYVFNTPAGSKMLAELQGRNGDVFHTYSAYARGLDILVGTYNFLDLTPRGRDEDNLPWSMAWVRHHDRYEAAKADSACCQPSCCQS